MSKAGHRERGAARGGAGQTGPPVEFKTRPVYSLAQRPARVGQDFGAGSSGPEKEEAW